MKKKLHEILVTLDLVEMRHKSIRLLNNTIRNPTNFYFFDIFLLLGAPKIVKNIKKTSRGKNSKFGGEFGDSKIFKPTYSGDRHVQNFFLSILIYGTLKSEFVCESYGCFTNGLRIRGQNGPKVGKICGDGWKLMEMVGKNTRIGL